LLTVSLQRFMHNPGKNLRVIGKPVR